MNKLIPISFIVLIISLSFCSALDFGISPGIIKLSEKPNEIVCKNFTIIGGNEDIFNGNIKWSNTNSKDISDYKISSKELNINSTIPSEIKAGKYQICISSEKAGSYYGALMYKINNSSYGIGTWIELKVEGNNPIQNIISLTGSTIKGIDTKKAFLFTPILLLVVLIFLLRKLKRRNNTEFNKNI
jgi:hypothetical protein